MGASVSPQGFTIVGRGRGYRPVQVDRCVAELSQARDAAWERAARLTVLANELSADAERLRETVSQLAPQTYESLGDRAQLILMAAEEEETHLRAQAEAWAQEQWEAVQVDARLVRDQARDEAERVREAAEASARSTLEAAQAEVEEVRAVSRQDVKEWRGEALAALKDMRQRTAAVLVEQEREHGERWEAAGRELAERDSAMTARLAQLEEFTQARLADAKREYAMAEQAARLRQEDAQAQAAEIIAQARAREDRLARETERTLRDHLQRREELKAHLEHVRGSLAALTGKPVAEDPGPGSRPELSPES
ncbi:cellulose-binding protein [Streptomyces sp. NA02950]|uniref:cellulose-binding protein n=1 Tax=Streptomyces sp. NA02950 TaxID=2742137 RepID=UPI001590DB05|nr:cellulose-binding protein [Streptomyces sp. NA02950]QKV92892.1 cellulose-binding protein [Streptomyces sp. NA02950]